MITGLIIAIVFAFAGLVLYACCNASSRAERLHEKYLEEREHELHGQNNNNDNDNWHRLHL